MSDWEEKLICPYCKSEASYDVGFEVQGSEGVMSFSCCYCQTDFEVDYYPVIEFEAREINV